jgi:hypothetical protein
MRDILEESFGTGGQSARRRVVASILVRERTGDMAQWESVCHV